MLSVEGSILVVVDVQGKLAELMDGKETLFENLRKMIRGAKVLGIPIIWVEQNPDGLGRTVPEIADLLADIEPIAKMSFSCCGNEGFVEILKGLNRKQVLIAGIEAHVCVYQTAVGLTEMGYEVHVVTDAVSSRTAQNREIGLEKIKDAGGRLTSVETALFELLRVAEGEKFKEILRIVK